MTDRRLPAVVWDMGGILYRYFTEVLVDWAPERGWDLTGIALGPTGPVEDPDYAEQMAGAIDEHTYLDRVRARLLAAGIDVDPTTAIHWPAQSRPATWRVVEAVHRAGHPQALLTNDASKWLGPSWWETWEPASWFDALVDVTTIGVRKPAPEPYLAAAAVLGLDPGDCVFVDDMVVNCAGAEAVGMGSVHLDIRDPQAAMDELAGRLGLSLPAPG
jgi:putative hydrolase of the HAD superfamily